MEDLAIKFEAQLVSASMTANGGHKIVLRINPEDILDNPYNSPEKSMEASKVRSLMLQQPNTRFICALVQLDSESDQPVEPESLVRARKISNVISMLCRTENEELLEWLSHRFIWLEEDKDSLSALKEVAGFKSRSELKSNPEAVESLERIVREYRSS
jgi:hypothetical protein